MLFSVESGDLIILYGSKERLELSGEIASGVDAAEISFRFTGRFLCTAEGLFFSAMINKIASPFQGR